MSLDLPLVTWSKYHVASKMGASPCKSTTCLVGCLWVFCSWRYNAFNLSRDLTWSTHLEVMRIYEWELLVLCHCADRSCDHRHCDRENIFFYSATWLLVNTCLKVYVNLWVESAMVNNHLAMFRGHWPSVSGDIKYLMPSELTRSRDWRIK